MQPDDEQLEEHFDASLPLPNEASPSKQAGPAEDSANPAVDLIRQKVQAAYAEEPDVGDEALDVAELGINTRSKHQRFIYELTTSEKSLAEIQAAWHDYYAGLTDVEKHQVWQEFYSAHAQASKFAAAHPAIAPSQAKPAPPPHEKPIVARRSAPPKSTVGRTIEDLRSTILGRFNVRTKLKPKQHLQSLMFGLGLGAVVILVLLFGFFNERFIAPFIQPSRTISSTPIISSSVVGPNPEIIIPKINVEIPVVYDVSTINEAAVETALNNGVVHYADTAMPGQNGNLVIVGHSSNNIFNPGKYKFAFVLLSRLSSGDTFYLQKDGKRYTYQVYDKKIVKPNDVSVLGVTDKPATATLITCDPPGTSINRLVVVGQQIDPDPSANTAAATQNSLATRSAIIPGNSPSLWSRILHWFER